MGAEGGTANFPVLAAENPPVRLPKEPKREPILRRILFSSNTAMELSKMKKNISTGVRNELFRLKGNIPILIKEEIGKLNINKSRDVSGKIIELNKNKSFRKVIEDPKLEVNKGDTLDVEKEIAKLNRNMSVVTALLVDINHRTAKGNTKSLQKKAEESSNLGR